MVSLYDSTMLFNFFVHDVLLLNISNSRVNTHMYVCIFRIRKGLGWLGNKKPNALWKYRKIHTSSSLFLVLPLHQVHCSAILLFVRYLISLVVHFRWGGATGRGRNREWPERKLLINKHNGRWPRFSSSNNVMRNASRVTLDSSTNSYPYSPIIQLLGLIR